MPDFHNKHNQLLIADPVNDSVLSNPHAIQVLFCHQLLHMVWTRD